MGDPEISFIWWFSLVGTPNALGYPKKSETHRNTHVPNPIINHAPEIMKYQKPYPPVNIAANPPLMTDHETTQFWDFHEITIFVTQPGYD